MGKDNNIQYEDLRILVVDDHMIMRNLISQNLTDLNCNHIDIASNGVEAFNAIESKYAENNPYHIVFLDWSMPEMDGLEVLQLCRKNKKYNAMAIIMLTAKSEKNDVIQAVQNGATSYIAKPTTPEKLKQHIDKTIAWLKKQTNPSAEPYTPTEKDQKSSGNHDKKSVPPEICKKLEPVVMTEMKSIFSNLFNVKVIPDHQINDGADKDMVCIGTLYQNNIELVLRFIFQQELLAPLLSQIYSAEYLDDDAIYDDAACEIVNILCNQVKTFLNKHGYHLKFDFPSMEKNKENRENSAPVMNISFSLKEKEKFYVDIQSN